MGRKNPFSQPQPAAIPSSRVADLPQACRITVTALQLNPRKALLRSTTWSTFQPRMLPRCNEVAPAKLWLMFVTRVVSHLLRSAVNVFAAVLILTLTPLSTRFARLVTADVSQFSMSPNLAAAVPLSVNHDMIADCRVARPLGMSQVPSLLPSVEQVVVKALQLTLEPPKPGLLSQPCSTVETTTAQLALKAAAEANISDHPGSDQIPLVAFTLLVSQLPMSWLNEVASKNMSEMHVTLPVSHFPMSRLNEEATLNIVSMLFTLPVSQLAMSWSKEWAWRNIPRMYVTLPVSQLPMSWLNEEASRNIWFMVFTFPVSQPPMFRLNKSHP